MSFHAVFTLFHVSVYNRFEKTLISYHPNCRFMELILYERLLTFTERAVGVKEPRSWEGRRVIDTIKGFWNVLTSPFTQLSTLFRYTFEDEKCENTRNRFFSAVSSCQIFLKYSCYMFCRVRDELWNAPVGFGTSLGLSECTPNNWRFA
jgi:hypothetical protein